MIWINIYQNDYKNWIPGESFCNGNLFKRVMGSGIDDYCHSLGISSFMTNRESRHQNTIRKNWDENNIRRSVTSIRFQSFYQKRGRFTLYYDFSTTSGALGFPEGFNRAGITFQDFADWWNKNSNATPVSKSIEWYERLSSNLHTSVNGQEGGNKSARPSEQVGALLISAFNAYRSSRPDLFPNITAQPAAIPQIQEAQGSSGSIQGQSNWLTYPVVESPAQSAGSVSAQQVSSSTPLSGALPNLIGQIETERNQRLELEQRLAASEARERERLAAEARERERPSLPPPTAATTIRSAHALVIGNAAYPGSGRLDNPVNDATAISQKLRAMGFTVTTVTDANRQRLVQAMSQFRRTAASAEVSLLFYSGHGVQVFGKNYMLPIDMDQTDVAQATIQGVSLNEVVENFLPGKTKLVFLDACRDNPLQRTGDRSVSRGLAPISVAEGTLIAYATKDGQVASDGTGQRNSPFTQALLEHLSDPSDIAVVLRKVREKVMRATGGKQQPWEYGSLTGGELVLSAIRPQR